MPQRLPDLAKLVESWQRALRAANKSDATLNTYTAGVTDFLRWCDRTGTPPQLSKPSVQQWVGDMLDAGAQPSTAITRLGGLKRFSAWLAEEEEIPADPLIRMPAPKLDRKAVAALTDDELRLLLKACKGKSFCDRRDEAIVRLLAETGIRATELVELRCDDLDLNRGLVVVVRGKGGKGRVAPFGPQTTSALDRYMRMRTRHAAPDNPQLFIGFHIPTFSYWGLARTLRRRAKNGWHRWFSRAQDAAYRRDPLAPSRWL